MTIPSKINHELERSLVCGKCRAVVEPANAAAAVAGKAPADCVVVSGTFVDDASGER